LELGGPLELLLREADRALNHRGTIQAFEAADAETMAAVKHTRSLLAVVPVAKADGALHSC